MTQPESEQPRPDATDAEASAASAADDPVSAGAQENAHATPEAGEPELTPDAADAERGSEPPSVEQQLAERTADLQRLQAEYVNYKRRVDRDRKSDHERAVARVITQLLPVLDDIDRAREHDELDGGFKSVAESVEQVARSFGTESFGAEGEPFDPMVHEALHMDHSDEVAEPSISKVVQLGYRIGDGVLRPARVLVVAPQE